MPKKQPAKAKEAKTYGHNQEMRDELGCDRKALRKNRLI